MLSPHALSDSKVARAALSKSNCILPQWSDHLDLFSRDLSNISMNNAIETSGKLIDCVKRTAFCGADK